MKISEFLTEIFQVLVVKFSIYLNRGVVVIILRLITVGGNVWLIMKLTALETLLRSCRAGQFIWPHFPGQVLLSSLSSLPVLVHIPWPEMKMVMPKIFRLSFVSGNICLVQVEEWRYVISWLYPDICWNVAQKYLEFTCLSSLNQLHSRCGQVAYILIIRRRKWENQVE